VRADVFDVEDFGGDGPALLLVEADGFFAGVAPE
jgi:hypothetical protein